MCPATPLDSAIAPVASADAADDTSPPDPTPDATPSGITRCRTASGHAANTPRTARSIPAERTSARHNPHMLTVGAGPRAPPPAPSPPSPPSPPCRTKPRIRWGTTWRTARPSTNISKIRPADRIRWMPTPTRTRTNPMTTLPADAPDAADDNADSAADAARDPCCSHDTRGSPWPSANDAPFVDRRNCNTDSAAARDGTSVHILSANTAASDEMTLA